MFFESFSVVFLRQLLTSSQPLARLNAYIILVPVTFRKVYRIYFSIFHAPIHSNRKITDIAVSKSVKAVAR
jgi:hypothetical protein